VKRRFGLLLSFLLLFPTGLITYRVVFLGYPIFPATPEKAWQFSMDARIRGNEREMTIKIALPSSRERQIVTEERITSGTLRFNLVQEGVNQVGVWSGVISETGEAIRYRAAILVHPRHPSKIRPPVLEPYPEKIRRAEQALANRLVEKWRNLPPPAQLRAVAATAAGIWGEPPPDIGDLQAWSVFRESHGQIPALLLLFRAANLPARVVEGLWLT